MDTPTAPKIPMTAITSLSVDELCFLAQWSGERTGKFPAFSQWLFAVVQNEALRRQSDGQLEPGDIEPPQFDAALLSDAVCACYVLSRQALTDGLVVFVDELDRHVVTAASAMLGEMASLGVHVQ